MTSYISSDEEITGHIFTTKTVFYIHREVKCIGTLWISTEQSESKQSFSVFSLVVDKKKKITKLL